METVLSEGKLEFTFHGHALKFDEEAFYCKQFNKLTGGKGVDFIFLFHDRILLIEVKDCFGEVEKNLWRLKPDNSGRDLAPPGQDVDDRDSLDIEVTKKVASTLSCLYGAWTQTWRRGEETPESSEKATSSERLAAVWEAMSDRDIPNRKKRLVVVLVLEGEFDSVEQAGRRNARDRRRQLTRTKKTVLKRVQDDIKQKLPWLNCRVSVVNAAAANENESAEGFRVVRRP